MGEHFERLYSTTIPLSKSFQLTNDDIRTCLREFRQWGLSNALFTQHYAPQLLDTAWWLFLSAERWSVVEQLYLALLGGRRLDAAEARLAQLERQFPSSGRVALLRGLLWEARGEQGRAERAYADLLEEDATHEGALKREIALHKQTGNAALCADALCRYLAAFMGDLEAWKELAAQYLALCRYRQAAFCVEELLLAHPENFHYCSSYADALFSQGGAAELAQARDYYLHALRLNDSRHNLRAVLGLLFACRAIDELLLKREAKSRKGKGPVKATGAANGGNSGAAALPSREENFQLYLKMSLRAHQLYLTHQPGYLVSAEFSAKAGYLSSTPPSNESISFSSSSLSSSSSSSSSSIISTTSTTTTPKLSSSSKVGSMKIDSNNKQSIVTNSTLSKLSKKKNK